MQLVVGGVGEEAAAERSRSRPRRRGGARRARGCRPAAAVWDQRSSQHSSGAFGLDAGLVADEPEEDEVGVDLAGEHRLEVELDVRLAGERDVVAQHAEHESVGDDAPQPLGGAVEQLLHEAVWALAGSALDAGGAGVDLDAAADEVDRRVLPLA